ncbi:MAG: Eco57I restriction-modification methylase domain-containing protein [Ignavibacteria bacterium]|nr:Eco57I restriction-modification methylase domain-containing protein [Ignavibacteria bacterium]
MGYRVTKTKEESFEQLKELISAFEKEYIVYSSAHYNEAQLRNDFINPLLQTFGWDVYNNEPIKSQFLRDVIQEETIDIEEEDIMMKKNPDYTLRIQGDRKLFVEAKRVWIDIEKSIPAAFQTKRYGWNANLGVSILTNFEKLIFYDCRYKPAATDDPSVARYIMFHFNEYLTNFDKLYNLLSYHSVGRGYLEDFFSLTHKDVNTFDEYFLRQIEVWRQLLAVDIIQNNAGINEEDINFLIQRLLNRIVFLRICEDREIEKYETLKNIKSYDELKALFIISDKKYNSGLFDFIEDIFTLNVAIKSEILIEIFNELYYPESPFDFSVIDPTILSQIYERYLGSKIVILNSNEISIVEEPEVAASNGVVPTPKLIVENIVKETLEKLFVGKSSKEITQLKIADICCGSGTFLISVYNFVLERLTVAYVNENIVDDEMIYRAFDGSYHLTLKAKQSLVINNIFGVDINSYAVEVTKFSLYLKLLENEKASSIENFISKYGEKVLPSLENNIKSGNSLIDYKYFEFNPGVFANDELLFKIKPFSWEIEFPFLNETKGFDAIIGNPPYVRIQNMVRFLGDEIKYYQDRVSEYSVAQTDSFDKYYLFIQKAINLLNKTGILGYIVPNKFFILKGGKVLRSFIVSNSSIFKIIHFGITQVFPNRSTYTAVIILDKENRENFDFARISKIFTQFIAGEIRYEKYKNNAFSEQPWIFVSKETENVFNKIRSTNTTQLKSLAEITVGLQTSADKIYIIKPIEETKFTFKFVRDNIEYEIEKAICKPCLYDLSFELFDTVSPNAQLIFPYNIYNDKVEVFKEGNFRKNFPLTWAYLNTFKRQLEERNINGSGEQKWYQFGRSQSLAKFHNTKKLIWPVLSTKPNYIYDEANLQFTGGGNGPYYSLISNSVYSPLYLLGILSHPLIEAMVKAGASEFRGDYYSHGKQFIENLPIREIDFENKKEVKLYKTVIDIVKRLIVTKIMYNRVYERSKKNLLNRRLDYLKNSLIIYINELYQITQEEMNLVLNDEVFLAAIIEEK